MKCPKCEIGFLQKIIFKKRGIKASLCEYCEALWLEGEQITKYTGHQLRLYSHEQDREYTFDRDDKEIQKEYTNRNI